MCIRDRFSTPLQAGRALQQAGSTATVELLPFANVAALQARVAQLQDTSEFDSMLASNAALQASVAWRAEEIAALETLTAFAASGSACPILGARSPRYRAVLCTTSCCQFVLLRSCVRCKKELRMHCPQL